MKEKIPYEHPENCASNLMKNDYMNEYLPLLRLLSDNERYMRPIEPKGFSERYPNMTFGNLSFKTTEVENIKIKELDELAERAKILFDAPVKNANALLEIAAKVAEICDRPDLADRFKEGLKE